MIPSAAEVEQPKLRRKHIGILRLNQDYGAPLICFSSVIILEIYAFLPPDFQEKASLEQPLKAKKVLGISSVVLNTCPTKHRYLGIKSGPFPFDIGIIYGNHAAAAAVPHMFLKSGIK